MYPIELNICSKLLFVKLSIFSGSLLYPIRLSNFLFKIFSGFPIKYLKPNLLSTAIINFPFSFRFLSNFCMLSFNFIFGLFPIIVIIENFSSKIISSIFPTIISKFSLFSYLFAIAFAFSIFGSIVTTFSQLLQNTCVSSPKSPPICRTVSFVLKGYQFIKFWLTVDKWYNSYSVTFSPNLFSYSSWLSFSI